MNDYKPWELRELAEQYRSMANWNLHNPNLSVHFIHLSFVTAARYFVFAEDSEFFENQSCDLYTEKVTNQHSKFRLNIVLWLISFLLVISLFLFLILQLQFVISGFVSWFIIVVTLFLMMPIGYVFAIIIIACFISQRPSLSLQYFHDQRNEQWSNLYELLSHKIDIKNIN